VSGICGMSATDRRRIREIHEILVEKGER